MKHSPLTVAVVSSNGTSSFTKPKRGSPSQPNLRQVHLIHAELFDEVLRSTTSRRG
ncbi:putative MOSC domain-containing protein [Streptomyces viridochromogenes Tue57]|uniref:Putative MOSC domain-containing protein n=1 Tax=Streptomyces viridochromogenes Tue57 TaxID=1160705 RepID=L8PK91_STRVR|nr:putative MOSC domain-containing protein [Streptomyces viridochromogenes Tue57]